MLVFFSWKIWHTARKLRRAEGDTSALYEDKSIWIKYSLFYDSYKKSYWWIFVPTIIYMFVKGVALAVGDGHGLAQTIAQLIIESVMFVLLLWSRPYERRSGNILNILIQVVRVLSIVCILVFVEEFGIRQTTQTVTGVVLIAVQSALTGILAILIVWNVLNICCKANPHRKRRKEMEKLQRDTLTPLDARNSLLTKSAQTQAFAVSNTALSDAKRSLPPVQPWHIARQVLQHGARGRSHRLRCAPDTPISVGEQRLPTAHAQPADSPADSAGRRQVDGERGTVGSHGRPPANPPQRQLR